MTNDADLRIFISYRRSDCQPQANALYDGLGHRLTGASIFMDIDSIPYGVDFEEHIKAEIAACDVVLVLIGDNWLDPVDKRGGRRIDQPDDFVRLEIENALAHPDVTLVPVLVEGASMPSQQDLPESIARLARLNAIELSDLRWRADIDRLSDVVAGMREVKARQTVSLSDLNQVSIESAVRQAYPPFQTKDISEAPGVVAAHGDLARARNFAQMVGTYLAKNATMLGIQGTGTGPGGRGETWQRVQAVIPPAPAFAPSPPPPPLAPPPPQGWVAPPPPPTGWPASPVPPTKTVMTKRNVLIGMAALSCCTAGFLSPVPIILALVKAKQTAMKRWLAILLVVDIAVEITGFVVLGTSPKNSQGTATGSQSDVGTAMIVSTLLFAAFGVYRYSKDA